MKTQKKIFMGIACLAIATLATVNVTLTESNDVIYLSLSDVEAMADPEWNHWMDWLDQGFTADEEEKEVMCQPGNNSTGAAVEVFVNGILIKVEYEGSSPAAVSRIDCKNGNVNCTPTNC